MTGSLTMTEADMETLKEEETDMETDMEIAATSLYLCEESVQ